MEKQGLSAEAIANRRRKDNVFVKGPSHLKGETYLGSKIFLAKYFLLEQREIIQKNKSNWVEYKPFYVAITLQSNTVVDYYHQEQRPVSN